MDANRDFSYARDDDKCFMSTTVLQCQPAPTFLVDKCCYTHNFLGEDISGTILYSVGSNFGNLSWGNGGVRL